jgi:hypothetical protein
VIQRFANQPLEQSITGMFTARQAQKRGYSAQLIAHSGQVAALVRHTTQEAEAA